MCVCACVCVCVCVRVRVRERVRVYVGMYVRVRVFIVSYNAEIKHIITIYGSRRCFKWKFMLTLTPYVNYRGHA